MSTNEDVDVFLKRLCVELGMVDATVVYRYYEMASAPTVVDSLASFIFEKELKIKKEDEDTLRGMMRELRKHGRLFQKNEEKQE